MKSRHHVSAASTVACSTGSGVSTGNFATRVVQNTLVASRITMRAENNSNDFGGFSELIGRFEFDFCRCGIFLNDLNFWCVQSSITHNVAVHVPVLWPDCAHAIPLRMLWCS